MIDFILDGTADALGITLFELQVFVVCLAIALGVVLGVAVIFEIWRRRRSPVDRLRAVDPFAYPFGDMPRLPSGSILHSDPASLAGGVDQGSGGNGNTSQRAAAARLRGRERRAY